MRIFMRLTLALLLGASPLSQAQDGAIRIIAIAGTAAPNLTGNFSSFGTPVINGSGNVAFVGTAGSSSAVYKTSGTNLVTIAKTGDAAPGIGEPYDGNGDTFTSFANPLLNEAGVVAFYGYNGVFDANQLQKRGIYTGTGAVLTTIGTYGQSVAGLGIVTEFADKAALSDSGGVALTARVSDGPNDPTEPTGFFLGTGGGLASATTIATTTQPVSGITFTSLGDVVTNNVGLSSFTGATATSSNGIYTKSGGTLNTVVTTQQTVPGLGGNFSSTFASTALNDKGTVVFIGSNSTGGRGVFTGAGGALTAVATTATAAPGLGGNFTFFYESVISNSGLTAFWGYGPSPAYAAGLYTGSGGALQTVATTLQTAPMIGGNFAEFSKLAINDVGTVAFIGKNSTLSTGPRGIYLSDGQEIITAAYSGQTVSGSTITDDGLTFVGGGDRGSGSQVNNNGQVSYQASLLDGRQSVLIFTPTLHFRNAAGGSWATRTNWTLGILPASVHDVVIDPVAPLSVTGPMLPTTVKSLTVGSPAGGIAELALQSSGTITATSGASTLSNGKIRGTGRIIANLTNAGTMAPGLPAAAGLITISGNLTLQPTSHLALDLGGLVRKTSYDYLSVSGTLTLGGSLDVSLLGGFVPQIGQTFDLFDAPSITGTFSPATPILPSLGAGLVWNTTQLYTTGVISVSGAGPTVSTWTFNGSGSWSASLAGNWSAGVPDGSGAAAIFGPAATSPATITVSGAKTVGSILFNNTNTYTVSGADPVTLADGATTPSISVTTGSHLISAPLILAQSASVSTEPGTTLTINSGVTGGTNSLTKTGAGLLNLDGTQTYAALNASAGITNVDGAVGTGATAVSVTGAGTTLKFGSVSQTLSSLTIGAGSTVIFTSGVASFSAGGGKALALGGSAAVPEPGTAGLLLTGVLGLLARRRRKVAR